MTLTGLGLKFSSIVIAYAGGSLLLTAIYTALIVWIIGLAVPVTASYIICAVIAAPALIKLGVPDYAAHMFIFYYAVLSEVSPPTALSPFAAAAITGGDPYRTTLQSWKYTLPAFLVPFVFVLDPQGVGLLLTLPKGGSWIDIVEITFKTTLGLMALAAVAQNWALRQNTPLERGLLLLSGLLLVFPSLIEALVEAIIGRDISYTYVPGLVIGLGVLLWQSRTRAQPRPVAHDLLSEELDDDKNEKNAAIWRSPSRRGSRSPARHAQQKTMRDRRPAAPAASTIRSAAPSRTCCRRSCRRTGDRRSHRRLGRQPEADRVRPERDRLHHGRRRARRAEGQGQVQDGKVPLQTLLVVYPNRMHVVTIEAPASRRCPTSRASASRPGSPGSATEVMAFRVIEAAGLDKDKDMKRERLGVAESVNALKDRKIDAFFWVGGLPTAAVTDLAATPGVKIKLIDHADLADKMNAKYGKLYTASTIKAGSYPGGRQGQRDYRSLEHPRHRRQDDGRRRLCDRQDAGREEGRPRRRAQGSRASRSTTRCRIARRSRSGALKYFKENRRAEVLQGKGHRRLEVFLAGILARPPPGGAASAPPVAAFRASPAVTKKVGQGLPASLELHVDTSQTSAPKPEVMMMQPRTFRVVLSLAHTAKPPLPKNELVFGGSVSATSNEYWSCYRTPAASSSSPRRSAR